MTAVDADILCAEILRTLLPGVTVNVEYAVEALTSPAFLEVRATDGGELKQTETVSIVDIELIGWSTVSRGAASGVCRQAAAGLRHAWIHQVQVPDTPGVVCAYRGALPPVQIRLGNQPATTWRYRSVVAVGVRTPNELLGV